MMGSGKSTVGRAIAGRLGVTFVDLDRRIECVFGVAVREAFAQGEAHFRTLEREALRSLLAEPAFERRRSVVATGGGAVLDPGNRAQMDAAGPRVLLRVPTSVLAVRLRGAAEDRPLVAASNDLERDLEQLWTSRAPAYETAPVAVDGVGEVPVIVDRVISALDLGPQSGERGA